MVSENWDCKAKVWKTGQFEHLTLELRLLFFKLQTQQASERFGTLASACGVAKLTSKLMAIDIHTHTQTHNTYTIIHIHMHIYIYTYCTHT